jgi:predicted nucleic acid-binding protein
MFVLDANVVSALRKVKAGKANKNVGAWSASVSPGALFLSVVTILELETGILLVERRDPPAGAILRKWLDGYVLPAFTGRILPFDEPVAKRCAALHVPNRCTERDAIVAATALLHRMTMVARNVAHFQATGVNIQNPWDAL